MLSYLAEDLRKNDNDRFLATLLAPHEKREEIFTIYAFNQELAKVKETTKEEMIGMIRFQWWREAIEEIYSGKPRKHDVVERLSTLIKKYNFDKNLFLQAIDEREKELDKNPFKTEEEFFHYAKISSGNIFRLIAEILGAKNYNKEVLNSLAQIFVMQGILRASRFNAANGKIFFPENLLIKHNINVDDFLSGQMNENIHEVSREITRNALSELKNFNYLIKKETLQNRKKLLPITVLSRISEVYLRRVKRGEYNVFQNDFEGGKPKIHFNILLASIKGKI